MTDWVALRREAEAAATHAYAPYSHYRVGAAGLVDDGRVVAGCNVENASYGLTLCAECGMVSDLHLAMPCGRCRQVLWEAGGPTLEVLTDDGPVPMSELLPMAWDAGELS